MDRHSHKFMIEMEQSSQSPRFNKKNLDHLRAVDTQRRKFMTEMEKSRKFPRFYKKNYSYDIAEEEEKPSMNLRIIWSKIRDYFGKTNKTKSVPIIKDVADIQKKVEEIKDRCFFIQLQREFKKVPKRSRKHMKLQFIKFIQDAQPTKYESHEDEGCFIDLMTCIKQEVLLF